MAISLAELIILGLIADWMFRRVGLPGLVGMVAVGIVLGPFVLGVIDPALLAVGADLRLIALIVILLRVGFALNRNTLHRVGARVLLLSVVPATIEGVAVTVAGPWLLGMSYLESALLGSVLAAVSPAVVVPAMLGFIKERRGTGKDIPAMIMAAASVDDIYVIVVHQIILAVLIGQDIVIGLRVVSVPVSLLVGAAVGIGAGTVLYRLFDRFNPRATKRVLVVIALAVLLLRLQQVLAGRVPFAGLVAAMAIGFIILEKRPRMAHELSAKLVKIWVFAELILFSLVGAQVDVGLIWQAGLVGTAIIVLGLAARAVGVLGCLIGSALSLPERLFVAVAYCPKATVQAAIGAAPLLAMRAAGLDPAPGELILAIAVLSIVLTAPTGAWSIALLGRRVLAVAPISDSDV